MYDWSKPVSWKEFKTYPQEIQEECLLHFSEKWGCSRQMFCEMAGVSVTALNSYQHAHNYLVGILKRQPTASDQLRFKEWLLSFENKEETAPAPVETKEVVKEVVKMVSPPIFVNTLDGGNLTMCGSGNEIAQTLSTIFQNARVEMIIEFKVLPEEEPCENG